METRVSIVEAKCRALMAAARWKGQAAQLTTGRARTPATQPQLANWNAGNIEITNTGTVRTAATHQPRPQLRGGATVQPYGQ